MDGLGFVPEKLPSFINGRHATGSGRGTCLSYSDGKPWSKERSRSHHPDFSCSLACSAAPIKSSSDEVPGPDPICVESCVDVGESNVGWSWLDVEGSADVTTLRCRALTTACVPSATLAGSYLDARACARVRVCACARVHVCAHACVCKPALQ